MKLAGLRVVDLSQFLPGPHLTMMLADHGAEVIKIEPPAGDPGRHIGLADGEHTVFFRNANRGKKSVVLDLKAPGAVETLLALAGVVSVNLSGLTAVRRCPASRRPTWRLRCWPSGAS